MDRLDRRDWLWLAGVFAWSVYWIAGPEDRLGFLLSWHFFVAGSRRMVGLHYAGYPLAGGLHLFANYPKLQIGPLSFLLALPIALLPPLLSKVIAAILMTLAGPVIVALIADAARRLRPWSKRQSIWAGTAGWIFVAPLWTQLAIRFGHFDDVLALLFVAAAVNAISRARPEVVALCLGAAVGSKPWAIAFIPLALMATDGRRLRHLAETIALAAVWWLPFVLGDSHTLRAAGTFKIRIVPTSVLALFHLTGGTPSWVRPCQFLGGALLAFLCVASGRWAAAVAIAIALRLGTDPNVYSYYATGLGIGAAIWDLLGSRLRAPLLTAATFVALYWSTFWSLSPHSQAVLRLVFVLCVPLLVLATMERVSDSAATANGPGSCRYRRDRRTAGQSP